MTSALCVAAKTGVDVRIITPGIPDKWYVHAVTRANYEVLTEAGVRIFEYRPGFIHAKVCLSDETNAVVGTVNMVKWLSQPEPGLETPYLAFAFE